MYKYLTDRDTKRIQRTGRESDARLPPTKSPKATHWPLPWLATPSADVDHDNKVLMILCSGVPPNFTHAGGANEQNDKIAGTDGAQWNWSTGERAIWTTTDSPGGLGDIEAWNFTGRTITQGTLVRIDRFLVKRSDGGFWAMTEWAVAGEKWINGTANETITFGDTTKSITVTMGDELATESHVVKYVLHDGGDISTGKRITARWWPTEAAYVIHLADCE